MKDQLGNDIRLLPENSIPGFRPADPALQKMRRLKESWNAPLRLLRCAVKTDGRYVKWNAHFEDLKSRLGSAFTVVLTGTRGTGKSQLGMELMRANVALGRSAYFATAMQFFQDIKATYKHDTEETDRDVLKRYRRFALLVIDEIGRRSDSAWENNMLFELLNWRYYDLTDTVMTDNRTPNECAASLGGSITRRFNETGGIVHCNWDSFST